MTADKKTTPHADFAFSPNVQQAASLLLSRTEVSTQ
jgi:hypothetical protein